MGIGELGLQFCFPGAATRAIAAARIAQNEQLPGAVAERSLPLPPMRDGVSGKGGGVMRDSDGNGTSIGKQIVNAVGYGDAGGVGAEIVIVDQARRQVPACSRIIEIADQFALLGIDANDGMTTTLELVPQVADVEELLVAVGTVVGGEFLVIDAQRITHPMEKTGHRIGADDDTEVAQGHRHLGGRSSRPLQAGDGIPGGVVFEQELDQSDEVGGFFSTGLRPPPERRVRPDSTF